MAEGVLAKEGPQASMCLLGSIYAQSSLLVCFTLVLLIYSMCTWQNSPIQHSANHKYRLYLHSLATLIGTPALFVQLSNHVAAAQKNPQLIHLQLTICLSHHRCCTGQTLNIKIWDLTCCITQIRFPALLCQYALVKLRFHGNQIVWLLKKTLVVVRM